MKKLYSLLAGVCMCACIGVAPASAAELNIYASGLTSTEVSGNKVTITYVLNAPATALEFQVMNGTTLVAAIPITDAANLAKGKHTGVEIDLSGYVPAGSGYTWALKATAEATTLENVLPSGSLYNFYLSQGIAIDNNPGSPFFGNLYVTESINGASDGASARTKTTKKGIFIYDALMQDVSNQGVVGWSGGVTWSGTNRMGPRRLAVDEEGYVYVTDAGTEGTTGVWRMDPANPSNDFVAVLDPDKRGTNYTRIMSLALKGTGEARKLYVTDNLGVGTGNGWMFPIGNTTSYSGEGTDFLKVQEANVVQIENNLFTDNRDGFWITQYRASLDVYPIITHYNSSGKCDYFVSSKNNVEIGVAGTQRGGGATNPSATKLVIGSNKTVVVYDITWTDGIPSLSKSETTITGLGNNNDGMAIDVADNLFITSASTETLYAFPLPKADNTFTTPAPSKYVLNGVTKSALRKVEVGSVTCEPDKDEKGAESRAKLSWGAVPNATSYDVTLYKESAQSSNAPRRAPSKDEATFTTETNSILISSGEESGIGSGENYYYTIVAKDANGNFDDSEAYDSRQDESAADVYINIKSNPTMLELLREAGVRVEADRVINERAAAISLYDPRGALLISTTADIDLSTLPAGVYLLRVGTAALRLVK